MLLLAFQAVEAAKVGERAGFALVDYGIVGVILALSLGANLLMFLRLQKVQDKRVDDKEADTLRIERLHATTTEALSKLSTAITSLERSDRDGATLLHEMKTTLNNVVIQSLYRGRSPAHGIPRVREDEADTRSEGRSGGR